VAFCERFWNDERACLFDADHEPARNGGAAGDSPHTPRGCPFQAWSLGALLRVGAIIRAGLAEPQSAAARRST
jgi:hypothetical protein